jgi:hypothetical protein
MLADLMWMALDSTKKFFAFVVMPVLIDLFYDLYFMFNIVMQGVYDMLSTLFLWLSKCFLNVSQFFHAKSEDMMFKNWN